MTQDELKQAVAKAAVDYALPKLSKSDILGIGTGSTANYFIDYIAQYKDDFRACVSSSEASTKRLEDHGIEVLRFADAFLDDLTADVDRLVNIREGMTGGQHGPGWLAKKLPVRAREQPLAQ